MLKSLQKKWKVTGLQLVLIIATFAIGGSLTGYAGRKLLNLLHIEQSWLWIVLYILLITLLWPMAVILVSIPFGQFRFFMRYIKKIGTRMGLVPHSANAIPVEHSTKTSNENTVTTIAIFASGAGSNAQKIIEHFRYSTSVKIAVIMCNNADAGIKTIAANEHIPFLLIEKKKFSGGDGYCNELNNYGVNLIILAGFLWKLPSTLIKAWRNKIVNIHPALLPAYGGKGMYGHFVHEAVIANKEKESGITIHYVDEIYDHGKIIFQAHCPVLESDTAISLAKRILMLEHEHYPKVIDGLISRATL